MNTSMFNLQCVILSIALLLLYRPLYEVDMVPIILLMLFFTPFVWINWSIYLSKELKYFLAISVVFMLLLLFNCSSAPIVSFTDNAPQDFHFRNNIIAGALVSFLAYIIGYLYAGYYGAILKVFSVAISVQVVLSSIFILLKHGLGVPYNLGIGILLVITFPYFLIAVNVKSFKNAFILFGIIGTLLICFSSRGALIALIAFIATYYFFPRISISRLRYNLFFLINTALILILVVAYIYGLMGIFEQISEAIFNKKIASGRGEIWTELSQYILKKPEIGYGSMQSSSYLKSQTVPWRDLSSHSTYFEVLLRGGWITLSCFLIILHAIWNAFFSPCVNHLARIAASSEIAFMYLAASAEIGITQGPMFNILIWLIWGSAAGMFIAKERHLVHQ